MEEAVIVYDEDEADKEIWEQIVSNCKMLYITAEGTVPGDRSYGIDNTFLDYPIEVAKNLYALEVYEKTEIYETRVKVESVSFELAEDGKIIPYVKLLLASNEELEEV